MWTQVFRNINSNKPKHSVLLSTVGVGFLDETFKKFYLFAVKYYLCKKYIENGCFYTITFNHNMFQPASYLKKYILL
jgi:hypothetical protein